MAPDGNCKQQVIWCLTKAKSAKGKLKHSKLSPQAKWAVVTSIIEPGVQYPLIASLVDRKDFEKFDRLQMHCSYGWFCSPLICHRLP